MPNWCSNDVTIYGIEEQPAKDLVAAAQEGKLLNWIAPMPKELEDTKAPSDDGVNWYNWRVHKWGTKWDVDCHFVEYWKDKDGTYTIELSFDSAWSPPLEAMQVLLEKYPDIDVDHYYFEPGCDFCGCNGDDYSAYEIYKQTKDGMKPNKEVQELIDRFGLMEGYYDDEEEAVG